MTETSIDRPLVFVKLGGSLITDKRHRSTPRLDVLRRLALELQEVLVEEPPFQLILGHGSGSFGHWEASKFGTRDGVRSFAEWHGFARVSAAALQLNRLVTDSFIEAGVPVLSLQPAASALTRDGTIIRMELDPLRRALRHGLVPLVFGDVAFDTARGGTILSTEDIFVHLAEILKPTWILLLGSAPGVLDAGRRTIPTITPASYPAIREQLRGSGYTDVTGGMADKVRRMVTLVEAQPELSVRILSGHRAQNLADLLRNPEEHAGGTLIRSSPQEPS